MSTRCVRDASTVATVTTAATPSVIAPTVAPATRWDRRPVPEGSTANDAPRRRAGEPRNRLPVRARVGRAALTCGVATSDDPAMTSDATTSVKAAPTRIVWASKRRPGSGSARRARPRGKIALSPHATTGTPTAPVITAGVSTSHVPRVRCARVKPNAAPMFWCTPMDDACRPNAVATTSAPATAATAAAIFSVVTSTPMLGPTVRRPSAVPSRRRGGTTRRSSRRRDGRR